MIRSLSFLSPGNFPDDDPYAGLEDTLRLFELGEQLGRAGTWLAARCGARPAITGARPAAGRRWGVDTCSGPGHTCSLSVLVIIY
jgi:hypothetical protein